jgi:hypothetical protein
MVPFCKAGTAEQWVYVDRPRGHETFSGPDFHERFRSVLGDSEGVRAVDHHR